MGDGQCVDGTVISFPASAADGPQVRISTESIDRVRTPLISFPPAPTESGLSAHEGTGIRRWANPIEAYFGPLRQFTIANSNHPHHAVRTRALHAYLRWRNANARHRDVLAAERKERARTRSEKGIRRGGRPLEAAA